MADKVGLYFKTAGIETGGTNALTGLVSGGTLVSIGSMLSPVMLPVANTVYTLYYRTIDDVTLDDVGKNTSGQITIVAPTGCEVCPTWDGTFAQSCAVPIAVGAYKPLYIKRITAEESSGCLSVGAGGVVLQAGTRLGTVGTVSLVSAERSVTATWDSLGGASGYEVQYRLSGDSTWTSAADVTSPSVIASLVAGGIYEVRVRAFDANGVGSWSNTAQIDTWPTFSDAFTSLDTQRWGYQVSGSQSQSISGGKWVFTGATANADAAVYWLRNNYVHGHSVKIKAAVRTSTSSGAIPIIGLHAKSTAPAIASFGTILFQIAGYPSGGKMYFLIRYDVDGGHYYCWTNTWAYDTYQVCDTSVSITDGTQFTFIMEYNATAGTGGTPALRGVIKSANEVTTYITTNWVTISTLRTTVLPLWITGGEAFSSAYWANFDIESVEVY